MSQPIGSIAYFSMEIALENALPTYSGGLGVLAGDTIRSAADLEVPMVAMTLLHRKGYFFQELDSSGWQREQPVVWVAEDFLEEMPTRITVPVEDREVHLRAWKFQVKGITDFVVPIYFLDSDLPENNEYDRTLTHYLYGGDRYYRLCQEVILGIGGVRMLSALGYKELTRYHMNEGHAGLLTLELLDDQARKAGRTLFNRDDIAAVRSMCVFTTHTPVPAGHDKFSIDLASQILRREDLFSNKEVFCCEGMLNLTYLALNLSHFVNGVAKKHAQVSQLMFAGYKIDEITNGVHAARWVADPFQRLFDQYIPGWRTDNFSLRFAHSISLEEIWQAHLEAKRRLLNYVNRQTNAGLEEEVFTIGFARRATAYKRADLLVSDEARLKAIAANGRPFQVIYAGKAHPQDSEGKRMIQNIYQVMQRLRPHFKMVYLENYDLSLAQWLTSGVDLWLNTPQPPMEASGTSGMKAALNGVPSFSILDGWWMEGWIEGVTGWAIDGPSTDQLTRKERFERDAASLYDKLERVILPLYSEQRERYQEVMRHCISINGSFFHTQRMMHQYVLKAYFG